MATSTVSRLASVTARDGVDTRNKEIQETWKTVCRSDTIIGLGVPTLYWGDFMLELDNIKAGRTPSTESSCIVYKNNDEEHVKFLIWVDMIEEPEKYGDDICEWLDLNDELLAGRKAWRIQAYWLSREAELEEKWGNARTEWKRLFTPIAKQAASECMSRWISRDIKNFIAKIRGSVTKIQSIVRGYQVRSNDMTRDCCMCLSHTFSPLRTDVGYMCRKCGEDGPYTDVVPDDPWNWFRAEYVDETAPPEKCIMCTCPLDNLDNGKFCDPECLRDYQRD